MTQDTTTQTNPYNIASLRLEVGAAQVEIGFGSEFSLTVPEGARYESTVENGTWIIRSKTEILQWLPGKTRYTVTLPHGTVLDALTLDIGAGMLTTQGICAQSAKLVVGAGKMDLKDLCIAGDCKIDVGAGVFTLTGALAGRSKIDCGMGMVDIALARPADYGYRVQCAMGCVKVDGFSTAGLGGEHKQNETAATFYEIDCGMGSVNVHFA